MARPRTRPADPRSSERGQALALFAGGLVALLVATGFVLDGGLLFVNRRDAQNASDLGALTGTAVIAEYHQSGSGTGSDVYGAIDEAVQANGCTPSGEVPCTWTAHYVRPTTGYDSARIAAVTDGSSIPATAQGVEVLIDRDPPVYFLRVIGQTAWDVGADAIAITARIDSVGEGILLPIAFDPGRELVEGNRYRFSEEKDGPGNFSWLSWFDDPSATLLERNVCNPRNPGYTFPVYIPGGPGKMNKKGVRDCLAGYVGQTVYVPLWGDGGEDCADGPSRGQGSNLDYCVTGVAAFRFEGYSSNPAIDDIWGTFEEIVTFTSIGSGFGGPPCNPASETCLSPTAYLGLIE